MATLSLSPTLTFLEYDLASASEVEPVAGDKRSGEPNDW